MIRKNNLVILFLLGITISIGAQQKYGFRTYADQNNLFIGTAFSDGFYAFDTTNIYVKTMRDQFNTIVAGNRMKFDAIEPQNGVFDFADADKLVAFAQKNNMRVRGHCLLWHSQLPGWITNGTFTRDSLLKIMKRHIITVVSRYKGQIAEWDVLNEAFLGNGAMRTSANGAASNEISKWNQIIGDDYIDSAFVWAHQADPNCLLYYNDYNTEDMGAKSEATFQMAKKMLKKGIPIHGIGFQSHFILNDINFIDIERNIKRIKDSLNLKVAITEIDIRIPASQYNDNSYGLQASQYGRMMQIFLRNSNCSTFVFWDYTDAYSWIPNFTSGKFGDALIFNRYFEPKQAYFALIDTLSQTFLRKKGIVPSSAPAEGLFVYNSKGTPVLERNKDSALMKVYVIPSVTTNKNIIWTLTNTTGTAKISSNGMLTAVSNGFVKMTASLAANNTIQQSVVYEMKEQFIDVSKIEIYNEQNIHTITTPSGELALKLKFLPIDAKYQRANWSVDNSSITSINADGVLKALANGIVKVRATAIDGSGIYGEFTVTVTGQITNIENNIISYLRFDNQTMKLLNTKSSMIDNVSIYNVIGRLVFEERNISTDINCSGLMDGIYIVKARIDGKIITCRFQK